MKDKSNKQTNAGTAYPLRAAEFTSGIFGGVRVAHFYSFLCFMSLRSEFRVVMSVTISA
jgi:hypothetical protein